MNEEDNEEELFGVSVQYLAKDSTEDSPTPDLQVTEKYLDLVEKTLAEQFREILGMILDNRSPIIKDLAHAYTGIDQPHTQLPEVQLSDEQIDAVVNSSKLMRMKLVGEVDTHENNRKETPL